MKNKSTTCSDKKIDFDAMVCKSMVGSLVNELYVTESSLADGVGYLDKEMTLPVKIKIVSRLQPKLD